MGYVIWLALTTGVGAALGEYCPHTPHAALGALVGFLVGVAVLAGGDGADDFGDALGGIDFGD